MLRKPIWTGVQVVFVVAAVWFAGYALWSQWGSVRTLLVTTHPAWGRLVLSCIPVLVAYAMLIELWRNLIAAWGEGGTLGRLPAARIWFIANLGRYVPGKVWQIAAMGIMAQRQGVSAVTATGASLVANLANIASGFIVVLVAGAGAFRTDRGTQAGILLAAALGAGLLLLPPAMKWARPVVARLTGNRVRLPELPARAVWLAALGTTAAWVLYGIAFRVFAAAMIPTSAGAVSSYIASYTASYLIGYLALFAPGGLVVREGMLVASLTGLGLLSAPEAWLMAIASRLWLTVLEVVPGFIFLLYRGDRS